MRVYNNFSRFADYTCYENENKSVLYVRVQNVDNEIMIDFDAEHTNVCS